MAIVTWKTQKKATVRSDSGNISFEITIKKSAGGLSFNLLNSDNIVIKSAGELTELQEYAKQYYRFG